MVSIVLQLAAILVFPFIVSGSVAYLAWGDLRRPWVYLLVATGMLYAVYGLTFVFLGESIAGLFSVARGNASQKKYAFEIDNIDLVKGSARYIDSDYAGNLSARWGAYSLSFTSQRYPGNTYVTTVFPQYAAGTDEFFVVESRHINQFWGMAAGQSFGSCSVVG